MNQSSATFKGYFTALSLASVSKVWKREQNNITREAKSSTSVRRWYQSNSVMTLAILAGLAASVAWAITSYHRDPRAFIDLDVYRLGIQSWWDGHALYAGMLHTRAGFDLPFNYPPFAAAVLSPLELLPWFFSVSLMLLLALASVAAVVYVTVRRVWAAGGVRGAVVATALAGPVTLFLSPVAETAWFGQVNLLLMALVAVDCLVERPRWPRGVLVGVAAAIKLTPAVFLLYFLLRKDFRSSITVVLSTLAVTAIGFLVNWSGSMAYWFGASKGPRGISNSPYIANQSIAGGLARLGLPQSEQSLLWLGLSAVVLVATVIGIRGAYRMDSAPLAMVITGVAGLLVSPTSWVHHWVYVVPAIIVCLAYGIQQRRPTWVAAAVIITAVFFFIDPYDFQLVPVHSWWGHFRDNSFVFTAGALLMLFAVSVVWRWLRAGRIRTNTGTPSNTVGDTAYIGEDTVLTN